MRARHIPVLRSDLLVCNWAKAFHTHLQLQSTWNISSLVAKRSRSLLDAFKSGFRRAVTMH